MSRALAAVSLLVALAGLLHAQEMTSTGFPVKVGAREVLSIRSAHAGVGAAERAARARYALALALEDPDCGPEGIGVVPVGDVWRVEACGRRVVDVTHDDGVWEGESTDATARRWRDSVRAAFDAEKQALYSGRLVRRALLGLLYPVALVLALAVLGLLVRRFQAYLLVRRDGRRGIKVGPMSLLEIEAERVFMARIAGLARWVASAALVYFCLAAVFRQFPATRDWAGAMIRPLSEIAAAAGTGFLSAVPRLLVLLVVVVVLRLALRSVSRLFERIRGGHQPLGPLVGPEIATPAEKTVKIVLVGGALVLAALLLPGAGGQALVAALLLAGLALALGAQRGAADLVAGLVVVYGRPFRTGQRIRVADHEGTVARKGLLHTVLTAPDGSPVLLPNRLVLSETVTILDPDAALRGRVVLEATGGPEAALAIVRSALSRAGLDATRAIVRLRAVRDGRLETLFDAAVPPTERADEARDRFLRALLDDAAAGGARVHAALDVEVAGR